MFASHSSRLESASTVARSAVFDAARQRCVWFLALPAICLLLPKTASAQCYYTYESIPKPPGWLANPASSINNLGQVSGRLEGAGDSYRVYTWSAATGTDVLPLLPGIISMNSAFINDAGVVAGNMYSNTRWYMYLRSDGVYTTIPLPTWANQVYVSGITNEGRVYGTITNNGTGMTHPFIWFDGEWNDVGNLVAGESSESEGLSATGRLVGTASNIVNSMSVKTAFELNGMQFAFLDQPAGSSYAYGCNNNELAVGIYWQSQGAAVLGAIWRTGQPVELTPPPTRFGRQYWFDANDAGRVVGYIRGDLDRANVWQAGQTRPLNDMIIPPPPYPVTFVTAINKSGQIAANTDRGAGLLTPHWLPGDLNGDCHVTLDDLVLVLMNFGLPVGTYPLGDADLDGSVGLTDLAVVLSHWGE